MPGPQPEPTALKIAKGSRKDRVNKSEPIPPKGLPVPPTHLSASVREIFVRVANDLDSMGLASTVDADNLATYCQALYEHRQASTVIAKQGILALGDRGQPVRNPACVVTQQTAAIILRFAREFGLTPSARTAMGSKHEPPDDKGGERLLA